jgi:hypothetical protein
MNKSVNSSEGIQNFEKKKSSINEHHQMLINRLDMEKFRKMMKEQYRQYSDE